MVRHKRKFCCLSAFLIVFSLNILFIISNFLLQKRLQLLEKHSKKLILIQPSDEYRTDSVDTWQFIGDPDRRQQIFSAYFDPRLEPLVYLNVKGLLQYGSVRVFAVLSLKQPKPIYCIFKYNNSYTHTLKSYEACPVHDHFNMKFSAYIIACPLLERPSHKIIHLPVSVAIATTDDQCTFTDPTFVQIRYGSRSNLYDKPEKKLSVCVGPLQQNYNQVLRIVEFIEMNRLLGVQKFYFYNLESTKDVQNVIKYYEDIGVAEVINWNFYGYKFEEEVRYNGIMVSINECIYRSTFVDNFQYVANLDLDEILMPFHNGTLLDYIEWTMKKQNNQISALIFRNTFFHKKFKSDYSTVPKNNLSISFLYTQVKIERTLYPYNLHIRSKFITNARGVIEAVNHQIWRSVSKFSKHYEFDVPYNEGLLFHYRTDCFPSETTCDGPTIIDDSARRFGSSLWNNVDQSCKRIFQNKTCPKSDWQ